MLWPHLAPRTSLSGILSRHVLLMFGGVLHVLQDYMYSQPELVKAKKRMRFSTSVEEHTGFLIGW